MAEARRRRRGEPPPILKLLELVEEHRPAFEYDWRSRFHLPLSDVGDAMTYGEAWRLLGILARDTSSYVAAAISGWRDPASREAIVLMDLFDLQHVSKTKHKPKPYPRPWPERTKTRTAPAAHLTQDEILAALRKAGHTAPVPMRRA